MNPALILIAAGLLLMTATRIAQAPGPRRPKPWSISPAGIDEVKQWEQLRLDVYLDQGGLPTVGWGHLIRTNDNLQMGDRITVARAQSLLLNDLRTAEAAVNSGVTVPLAQHEYDALVSFVFNVGAGAFQSSTLRTKLNAGNYNAVRGELARWNKVTINGQKVASNGLTNRRLAEADVFDRGYA